MLLLCAWPAQAGVNAQALQTRDGGDWIALREAEAGPPWTAALAYGTHYSRDLVVFIDADGEQILLGQVWTTELGVSVMFGEHLRVGAALPRHTWIVWRGELSDEKRLGDVGLWTTIPLKRPSQESPLALAWTVSTDFATGPSHLYLGDPGGSVMGHLAAERSLYGPLSMAANAGLELRSDTELPGTTWGNRFEYGVGLASHIAGPFHVNTELFGSTPFRGESTAANYPVEVLAAARFDLPADFVLSVGGGTGLTRGLGSPSVRGFAMLDHRPRQRPDSDGDGLDDLRDLCPNDPEDFDDWQDKDGCPEEDNDEDGLVDREDSCPNDPEVENGYRDLDGCPDRLVTVRLRVVSPAPELEQATINLGEFAPSGLLPGEWFTVELPPTTFSMRVTGEGHLPYEGLLEVPDEELYELEIPLSPILFGDLSLRLEDPSGEPLAGWLRGIEQGLLPVPAEGATLRLQTGPHELLLVAPSHTPARLTVEVEPENPWTEVVVLQPSGVALEDNRIVLDGLIEFELDSSVLLPESDSLLDEVAALLLSHPDIELLRVEGHADESGDSRYNLELSQARAEAVVAYLVEAGVDAEHLQALGTGEAEPLSEESRSRRVSFTVLVWDDEAGRPELP
ncbi:MAG TPA: OmpA family protein [Myxococcota bacterium]|nr:OmpA family protein [Myxococcota bacterium]